MFNYDVTCMMCGIKKVYEVSFKTALSDEDIKNKKSGGVCPACTPAYRTALAAKTKPICVDGPFFKIKAVK